ncbi:MULTISPECIES: Crp/Fnr family transcriptional regulator [unclassified Streptomyces]|uniref:Crp/Fnr family transcriptional regulator n=1 Tax=unclassified Streptomyces TaxID=2593676 RepID=UPI00365E10A6
MYQPHRVLIGDQLWSRMLDLAPAHLRPPRSVLLRQGDPATHVILLETGSTLVTLTGPGGNRTLLAVRGPGELLGELAVLDSERRSASVIAAETCRIHLIPACDFLEFVADHGLLASLLRHAIARVRESEVVRLEFATADVPRRLAGALARLARVGTRRPGGLIVRLTQVELSQMIGASRNAVGSAIKPWREQGWLETEAGGGLLIHDMRAIEEDSRRAT